MTTFRLRLLAAMGLGLTACVGDKTPADSGPTDSSSSTVDSGSDRVCADVPVLTADDAAQLGWDSGGDGSTWLVCVDKFGDCPATDTLNAHEVVTSSIGQPAEPEFCSWTARFECGPETAITDACCYEMHVGQICEGRPLTVDGGTRRPAVVAGDAWVASVQPDLDLEPEERARRADKWLTTARDEHASVAAFARWSLQLMHLGAPPELLVATQRAAADEVRHARLAFGLASAYAGRPMSAGPLPVDGALETDRKALVRAQVRDACVNETLAAIQAAEQARTEADPAVQRVLQVIADDEARHSELAWQTLVWLIGDSTELRQAARDAFDAVELSDPFARRAMARVVRPCAEALLG